MSGLLSKIFVQFELIAKTRLLWFNRRSKILGKPSNFDFSVIKRMKLLQELILIKPLKSLAHVIYLGSIPSIGEAVEIFHAI